jgi:hypothetical protein
MAEQERGPWDTESGLIDDVDGYISNPHFGIKEEYSQAVSLSTAGEQKGNMFLFDVVDANGEVLGGQGYSVGTGWVVSEDGLSISHATRKNVVTNTMYGQLQNRVVKELGVDMASRGLPTEAIAWDKLGFHWMQQKHKTVSGEEKTGLMPTEYIGMFGEAAPAETPAPTPVPAPAPARPVAPARPAPARAAAPAAAKSAGIVAAEKLVAETGTVKEFILKAVKDPSITGDEKLMSEVMDDSIKGFFKSRKGK